MCGKSNPLCADKSLSSKDNEEGELSIINRDVSSYCDHILKQYKKRACYFFLPFSTSCSMCCLCKFNNFVLTYIHKSRRKSSEKKLSALYLTSKPKMAKTPDSCCNQLFEALCEPFITTTLDMLHLVNQEPKSNHCLGTWDLASSKLVSVCLIQLLFCQTLSWKTF